MSTFRSCSCFSLALRPDSLRSYSYQHHHTSYQHHHTDCDHREEGYFLFPLRAKSSSGMVRPVPCLPRAGGFVSVHYHLPQFFRCDRSLNILDSHAPGHRVSRSSAYAAPRVSGCPVSTRPQIRCGVRQKRVISRGWPCWPSLTLRCSE